ncbi:hypothetical protein [Pedosphaera parvula]|uniref:DUF3352 domain-containing protein n=1 Tax=Pedosphaera parvula (strain Ellin514) TaxID=320771 RepID=B9XRC2_PEDPL|nr:hypothetical protein [Pedosphaera parvula]EEF57609.1 hypothetical protein Cflav_PD0477 [Pedosphaera parvula Ellin514]
MKKLIPILTAVACLALRVGATVLPAEKLLPDDTLFVFSIPDTVKAKDIYKNSPQGQLWNDPSVQAFKDKFVSKFKSEYVTPLERDLGIHFDDYTGLLQGQFTFAVTQNGWDGKSKDGAEPALLLLIDTKDKSDQLKTNLTDLKKKWVDSGKSIKTEKIRDIEFSVAVLSSNDLPKSLRKSSSSADSTATSSDSKEGGDAKKSDSKKQVYIGQAESMLILGDSPKVIEKVLACMSGASVKTLSESASFAANASLFREAPLFGWINAKALISSFTGSADTTESGSATGNPMDFKPEKVVAALGLNGLNTVAFNYLYANDGAQFNISLGVPESSRSGIFKILAGEPKETVPPPFIPMDAVKFQRWRIDGQKTWAGIQKIVNDISPQALNTLNFLLSTADSGAKDKDPNFDIKKNLFGNLGNDIITYQKLPKGETLADLNNPPSLFLLGSPNAEQLATALKITTGIFMGQSGNGPKEREFLGHKVYSVSTPATPGQKDAKPGTISFAASGGYVAITSDTSILEEYLRSSEKEGKSLRDAPGLSDASQKVVGSGTSLFGYSNDSESMRVGLEALKKDLGAATASSTLAPLVAASGMGDPEKIKEWIDPSLLPTFDKISKYFYFTVYGASANSDGLNFKVFAPVPPQLKK